jgi:hypothetical protein
VRFKKLLWSVVSVVGLMAVPFWFWMAALDNSYVMRSRVPVPESQQTQYDVKGVTVYLTEHEATLATWVKCVSFGLLGAVVGISMLCYATVGPYDKNSK